MNFSFLLSTFTIKIYACSAWYLFANFLILKYLRLIASCALSVIKSSASPAGKVNKFKFESKGLLSQTSNQGLGSSHKINLCSKFIIGIIKVFLPFFEKNCISFFIFLCGCVHVWDNSNNKWPFYLRRRIIGIFLSPQG